MSWSKVCLIFQIFQISKIPSVPGNPSDNPPIPEVESIQITGETFQVNNAKLYDLLDLI